MSLASYQAAPSRGLNGGDRYARPRRFLQDNYFRLQIIVPSVIDEAPGQRIGCFGLTAVLSTFDSGDRDVNIGY